MSQKLLISFLAVFNDGAFLMVSEALFQSLAESLLKLNLAALVLASSFQTFIELFRFRFQKSIYLVLSYL